jgi:hypothetical protein
MDPESSRPDLTVGFEYLQGTSPYPPLPRVSSFLLLTNPTNPTIAGVFRISKVFVVVGF